MPRFDNQFILSKGKPGRPRKKAEEEDIPKKRLRIVIKAEEDIPKKRPRIKTAKATEEALKKKRGRPCKKQEKEERKKEEEVPPPPPVCMVEEEDFWKDIFSMDRTVEEDFFNTDALRAIADDDDPWMWELPHHGVFGDLNFQEGIYAL